MHSQQPPPDLDLQRPLAHPWERRCTLLTGQRPTTSTSLKIVPRLFHHPPCLSAAEPVHSHNLVSCHVFVCALYALCEVNWLTTEPCTWTCKRLEKEAFQLLFPWHSTIFANCHLPWLPNVYMLAPRCEQTGLGPFSWQDRRHRLIRQTRPPTHRRIKDVSRHQGVTFSWGLFGPSSLRSTCSLFLSWPRRSPARVDPTISSRRNRRESADHGRQSAAGPRFWMSTPP
ncbi:hypothetical protein QBC33DRAFT_177346 [Phialemonium atrogriseum]|uniref:Uncharacterized protein n=1 Tax=Phialemonium atrogriseum TaxID=1093897 RepID=A0AAJ0C0E0_9PEZI|nr:uncharacterized protein QBC33DRAFT_177346 [Phialemonium atrogriseum]KAK1765366.1 hypothetical protein QBC33DRAFT_177346 [Phialemonium atrogriseum]